MTAPRGIYWDTNVVVALMEQSGIVHDLLWAILEMIEKKPVYVSTSALTFAELKVKPLQQQNFELLRTYEEWSSSRSWLDIWSITPPILDGAALLRATRGGLKLPDAIHLATALHSRCTHFLTADKGIGDITDLVHPVSGPLDITPLTILRPDEPTLTSLLKSMAE